LWHLGYLDQALKRIYEALSLAQERDHPFSLAFALFLDSTLHQRRRDVQVTQEKARMLITLSQEQGFPTFVTWGGKLRGWALAGQGQVEEGITQMRQGMAAWRDTGAEMWRAHWLALLAEVYGKVGQAEEGLTALVEALAVVDKTGERFYEAEMYRLRGELTLHSKTSLRQVSDKSQTSQDKSEESNAQILNPTAQSEAEACFLKAIKIAQRQQAKSLELRAATSLARLWQQQGKRAEAHKLLSDVYNWFTEGFDTKDLQEAKTLLAELSH
jgi:predicted ATPase